ncbi:MAG: 3'(2'),5'-bisphosphate nucleotidase CysQ [Candidatus Magasanikbacteria bacterium]|nr:3'(2'),5'-bisphosphate nucleotidase CysQ [Candidatus Magasanikbacteria bacterium]|tara:strand:- start:1291 stop:2079 length:789 start_codon:yes stop_codon:yes gene_type:complete
MNGIDPVYKKVIGIAKEAGNAIMSIYNKEYVIEKKKDNSLVTAADLAANTIIVAGLKNISTYPILSEEIKDTSERLSHEFVWIVDPLDGTSDFIKKNGEFSVMIGLVQNNTPIFGVSYEPVTQKSYYAQKGVGAFVLEPETDPRKLHVSSISNITQMTVISSRSHPEKDSFAKKLGITKQILSGGIGVKIGKMTEKKADIYYNTSPHTSIWDTCAPHCIIEEAGGKMTDLSGNPLVYNTKETKNMHGVLATNGIIHDHVSQE